MDYEVSDVVRSGPEQAARIIGLRLRDGSEITSESAIAMVQYHGAKFVRMVGNRWQEVRVVHRRVWRTELDG